MKIILNDLLNKYNKSQYWLSKETGIAVSTLNRLCNNRTTSIQFSVLERICVALNCSPNDIFKLDLDDDSKMDIVEVI